MKRFVPSQYKEGDVLEVTNPGYGFPYGRRVEVVDPVKFKDKRKNYCILVKDLFTKREGPICTSYVRYAK